MAMEEVVDGTGPGLGETELGVARDWVDGGLVSSGTIIGKDQTEK